MIYHVLSGDGMAHSFELPGAKIICRECLIDGPKSDKGLEEFWNERASFLKSEHSVDSYFKDVKSEFDKLSTLNENEEVNLWFGNDVFCQVNLWFVISFLEAKKCKIFRILPDSKNWDCTFSNMESCLESRILFTEQDLNFGRKLWKAFVLNNNERLHELSERPNRTFQYLNLVCQAIAEINTRPRQILKEIALSCENDFSGIFLQFKEKAGIYGFGDAQVKKILTGI